jgi:hypothetical protein
MKGKSPFVAIPSRNRVLTVYLFDGESLVYSELTRSLYCLDGWATYALFRLEEGRSAASVTSELSDRFPLYKNLIPQSVLSVEKLLNPESSGPLPEQPPEKVPLSRKGPVGETFRLLDTLFSISFPDRESENLLLPSLDCLRDNSGNPPDYCIELSRREKEYRWSFGDEGDTGWLPRERTLSPLLDYMRKTAYQRTNYLLAAHSGAVAANGSCVMLPGLSGSGKSTLCAGLAARGWEVLSDEVALVGASGEIRRIPFGIGLKEASWPLLEGSFPSLAGLPVWERLDGKRIRYLPPPLTEGCSGKETFPAGAIVFPVYAPLEPLALAPLGPVETLRRVTASGYQCRGVLTAECAKEVVSWVSKIPGYALGYNSLPEALGALETLHGA